MGPMGGQMMPPMMMPAVMPTMAQPMAPNVMHGGMPFQQVMHTYSTRTAPTQSQSADWLCPVCNNHNYASRTHCNRCSIPRETRISNTGMREGDWICLSCANHNYASKTTCNKCCSASAEAVLMEDMLPRNEWTKICSADLCGLRWRAEDRHAEAPAVGEEGYAGIPGGRLDVQHLQQSQLCQQGQLQPMLLDCSRSMLDSGPCW